MPRSVMAVSLPVLYFALDLWVMGLFVLYMNLLFYSVRAIYLFIVLCSLVVVDVI